MIDPNNSHNNEKRRIKIGEFQSIHQSVDKLRIVPFDQMEDLELLEE
jgi:hypothetical protein